MALRICWVYRVLYKIPAKPHPDKIFQQILCKISRPRKSRKTKFLQLYVPSPDSESPGSISPLRVRNEPISYKNISKIIIFVILVFQAGNKIYRVDFPYSGPPRTNFLQKNIPKSSFLQHEVLRQERKSRGRFPVKT